MLSPYGNVVFITGASSGIGRAVAVKLAREGFKVYGTSRNPREEDNLFLNNADMEKGFLKMIKLDVGDESSVREAVDLVVETEGRIDILINNAGIAIAGAVEETNLDEAMRQFDTNFFGILRMLRSVLPVMRNQKNGLIITIGSVMGAISVPFHSMYGASKHALRAVNEALRIEVKPFGIKSVLVEPGNFKTDLPNTRYVCVEARDSIYGHSFKLSLEKMNNDEKYGPEPWPVVRTIYKLINRKNPPVRVTVGFEYKVYAFLKRILPAKLVEFVVEKMYIG